MVNWFVWQKNQGRLLNKYTMSTTKYTPRLADKYKKEVVPALMKRFSYDSVMQVPRLKRSA